MDAILLYIALTLLGLVFGLLVGTALGVWLSGLVFSRWMRQDGIALDARNHLVKKIVPE